MYAVNMDCLFCKIIDKKIPADIIYEDEKIIVFNDINPQAPVHVLFVPKVHITKLEELQESNQEIIGYLIGKAPYIINKLNLKGKGVRLLCNNNSQAGQSVFHIHFHMLGGRIFTWPPG